MMWNWTSMRVSLCDRSFIMSYRTTLSSVELAVLKVFDLWSTSRDFGYIWVTMRWQVLWHRRKCTRTHPCKLHGCVPTLACSGIHSSWHAHHRSLFITKASLQTKKRRWDVDGCRCVAVTTLWALECKPLFCHTISLVPDTTSIYQSPSLHSYMEWLTILKALHQMFWCIWWYSALAQSYKPLVTVC